jgi:hypothetical protein
MCDGGRGELPKLFVQEFEGALKLLAMARVPRRLNIEGDALARQLDVFPFVPEFPFRLVNDVIGEAAAVRLSRLHL